MWSGLLGFANLNTNNHKTAVKQSIRLNDNLKPEQKKTTCSPKEINSQTPTFLNRLTVLQLKREEK